ncbi:MAG: two pore domain potassium channel family protein [Flavobacteriia bacterium]|nr:two pore domain potassium channel family protein [Flavobacteriia bacterium]
MSTYLYKSLIYIREHRFAFLLFGLIQHLYIGMTGLDTGLYETVVWPVNMVVLGIASLGVFNRSKRWAKALGILLLIIVFSTPLLLPIFGYSTGIVQFMSISYLFYFLYIAWGIKDCLFRPRSMTNEVIFASASGYFLLIEIASFLMMYFYAGDANSFRGIDGTSIATVYMDFVYFETITQSTVGFGDITPVAYAPRLASAFLAAVGQLYLVLLVGVIISRYAGHRSNRSNG